MNQVKENEQKLVFEINVKLQLKDYRLRYIISKGWIVALLIVSLKLSLWAWVKFF